MAILNETVVEGRKGEWRHHIQPGVENRRPGADETYEVINREIKPSGTDGREQGKFRFPCSAHHEHNTDRIDTHITRLAPNLLKVMTTHTHTPFVPPLSSKGRVLEVLHVVYRSS